MSEASESPQPPGKRRGIVPALVLVALVLGLGGYLYSATQLSGPEAQTLQGALEGGACLIDVRTPGEFAQGHLEGALNVPLGDLEARQGELPKDRPLVVY